MAFVDAAGAAGANGAAAASAATQAGSRFAQDFDTFLTILTTQLQAQDPLSPMDSSEFTNQLVNFASVEQEIQGNQNLERIANLLSQDQQLTAINYLGREAMVEGATGRLSQGEAGIQFSYALPENIQSTQIDVLNAAGRVVRSGEGQITQGRHDVFFAGIDEDGEPLPEGDYTLRVTALNNDDNIVPVARFVTDTVTAVDTTGVAPLLTVGGQSVSLDDVLALRTPNSQ
ncbi:MAG: flagellar hook assembly protein FlgD [Rhodothalassiaceae bacterium]